MGYFSNGTEGAVFEERQCAKCVHGNAECPVWSAHILFSYDLCNEKEHPGKVILDMLIPRAKDGPWNDDCAMFIDARRLVRK